LVTGTNVISASVHSNYRSTNSHSFELEAAMTVSPTSVREEPADPPADPDDPPTDPGDPPAEPDDPAQPVAQDLIPTASTWSYLFDANGPSGDWTTASFDSSS